MVEDVGLDRLVGSPGGVVAEDVDLQGEPFGGGGELAHQEGHLLVDAGVAAQVGDAVGAKGADVGQAAAVGQHLEFLGADVLAVVFFDLAHLLFQIGAQQADALELLEQRFIDEADGVDVDGEGALDAAAAAFAHPPPVAKGGRDQLIGRDGGDGLVPVLHPHGGQGNIDDIAVGAVLGHLDPVPLPHQIHGGDLHPGHQAENGILEDQQQDSGHSPQPGDEEEGAAVGQLRQDEDEAEQENDQFDRLHQAADGQLLPRRAGAVDVHAGIEQRIEDQKAGQNEIDVVEARQQPEQLIIRRQHQRQTNGKDHRRQQMRDAIDDLVGDHVVVPLDGTLLRCFLDQRHDDAARDVIGDQGDGKQDAERQHL